MIIHVSFCTTCRKFRMWVIRSDRLPVRFAIALLKGLKKNYAGNRNVVPPVCYAAKRNPWLAQNIHATNFLCSIELICLICWLKIVMIIHVSFCTTCRKSGILDLCKLNRYCLVTYHNTILLCGMWEIR
jgi:hypothetical protein